MLKIAVVGSGWASSSFIKNLDRDKHEITVLSPTKHFIYTPLLANNIKNNTNIIVDITKLNNIKYINNKVIDINFKDNRLITDDNIEHKYDYLVLSQGSDINTFNIKGIYENCKFIKNIDDVDKIREKLNNLPINSKIAVIGCGLTGTEIIGNLLDYNKFNIYAIDALSLPLATFNNKIRSNLALLWYNNRINCMFNSYVKEIDERSIYFKDNKIDYDIAIWCGGVKNNKLTDIINKKLDIYSKYGIPINKYMKVDNIYTNNVYAIGDCAYNNNPPTAQVAYQEGKYLANYFNNNCIGDGFKYNNKGQICYIGNGSSIYQYDDNIYNIGKLCGILNRLVHIYNSINIEQMLNIIWY